MRLPRQFSASVDAVAKAAVGKDWSLYATLIEHWAEIVGQDYAKSTEPTKITFPKGKRTGDQWASRHNQTGGTLIVKIPQGLTMEFGFLTDQMKERINGFFGYNAIEVIKFAPYYGGVEENTPQQQESPLSEDDKASLKNTIKDIENNELREALESLGESVLRESKR